MKHDDRSAKSSRGGSAMTASAGRRIGVKFNGDENHPDLSNCAVTVWPAASRNKPGAAPTAQWLALAERSTTQGNDSLTTVTCPAASSDSTVQKQ